ncbi:MAG: type II toxin-antitoxin system HigB family toxin [Deltaproteobacteria bacterium]|nr:type II toxin-antitoxin system HigB family toxin [Deltaproteobacteria bacterium]
MRIIATSTLNQYARDHPDAAVSLERLASWIKAASWASSAEASQAIPNTDPVSHDRLVFNVAGNKYRLVVAVDYERKVVHVKWFGTHAEYDRIDVATVGFRDPRH